MKKYFSKLFNRMTGTDVFSKRVYTFLYLTVAVCILIVSVAQTGLRSTKSRHFFTRIDHYEGAYFQATLNVNESEDGVLVLSAEEEKTEKSFIYLNGEEYMPLSPGENAVEIRDMSVVEVYSSGKPVPVSISRIGDGLVMYAGNERIITEKGINFICRVGKK